jgi:hypothetical protein
MASSEFPCICLAELGKFTRSVGTTAEIQTGHLPDTSQSYLTIQRNKRLSIGRTLERNASRHAMISLAQAFPSEARQVL